MMTQKANLLSAAEVAEALGVSPRTLSRWHALRVGPPRCRLNRQIRYRADALQAWLEKQETQPVRSFSEVGQ
ncbi:helix-turn-helix domain-containing protein [uncultured Roseovarius sp.]|uniref:helix-turn-helix transcriptional regulator n=1 Tax=uncultured Roseovarius sp. TaxID=293344 RepID=UPI00338F57DC